MFGVYILIFHISFIGICYISFNHSKTHSLINFCSSDKKHRLPLLILTILPATRSPDPPQFRLPVAQLFFLDSIVIFFKSSSNLSSSNLSYLPRSHPHTSSQILLHCRICMVKGRSGSVFLYTSFCSRSFQASSALGMVSSIISLASGSEGNFVPSSKTSFPSLSSLLHFSPISQAEIIIKKSLFSMSSDMHQSFLDGLGSLIFSKCAARGVLKL